MLENKKIVELLKRKISGKTSPSDLKEIVAWAEGDPARKNLLSKINDESILFKDVILWLELQSSKNKVNQKVWRSDDREVSLVGEAYFEVNQQGDPKSALHLL